MEPEKDEGNIEYKLKLINKNKERIEKLASQMRFRCEEGNSECIYNLGVADDGTLVGLNKEEYNETIKTLNLVADKNNYNVTVLSTKEVANDKYIYEVLIRENNINKYIDIKIAIAGSVDVGKSTFLSVLLSNKKDNGRGSARLSVFNYSHEIKSGRTSSIAQHILGYDVKGNIVNYENVLKLKWPEIVQKSSKIVTFLDLAGHEKYLKTTIRGLSSSKPDMCLILISANKGVLRMTREHIFLCITLKIPFSIVITKIDIVKKKREKVLKETMSSIKKILKSPGVRRIPVKIENNEDIIISAKQIHTESIVPIFQISNVTGFGLEKIKKFFNLLPKKNSENLNIKDVEYHIDSTWTVTGIGTVVGGYLTNGKIKTGDKLYLGPNNGKYTQVVIKSIHCKRVLVQEVEAGCYVCLALKRFNRSDVRKGNVIVSKNEQKIVCKSFIGSIKVLKSHSTTIKKGYEPIIHVSSVRQSGKFVEITNKSNPRKPKIDDNSILCTGDSATVKIEFSYYPEYVLPGMRFLCAEGRTKIIGIVENIFQ